MDPFVNGCHGAAAAMRREAQRRLDDLVSTPWYADSGDTEDVARVRHQIDIIRATNALISADLLDVAHSCDVCNAAALPKSMHDACAMCNPNATPDGTYKKCALSLSIGLIRSLEEKRRKMEAIKARILNRNALVKRLEEHLKTFASIKRSLNIVTPEHGIDYYYKIHPESGVNLVIRDRNNNNNSTTNSSSGHGTDQIRSKSPNLVDSEVLPPISTPALAPISARPATATVPTQKDHPKLRKPEAEEKEETKPTPLPKRETSNLQIWENEEERDRALRQYANRFNRNGLPLFFTHGIQYKPASPSPCPSSPTARSRMVVFSDLHPSTTWSDVLARVRGGPVLRAARGNATTVFVSFVRERDAHAYARHVGGAISVRGWAARVHLAQTPSYPVCETLLGDVAARGVTRCLAFPRYDAAFGRLLEACLVRGQIRDFVATVQLGVEKPTPTPTPIRAVTRTPRREEYDGDDDDGDDEGELSEEWIVLRDENCKFAGVKKKPVTAVTTATRTTATMDIIHLSFRDVAHAQAAYRLVRKEFPTCGVYYAPDSCAGPLAELED
ncbi:hypothetical protein F5Y12DRAFT_713034 [Xylaria sp. FL1777]|nr:hypothetical protein F5Y12DRAFT_713034 [Xylaria sp. FL1777]